jgi:sec-independent protein translocase protein TatA
MLGGIGIPELAIVLVIILVIFGAGKLPEIGGGMGKAIRNFKKSVHEEEDPKNVNSIHGPYSE